MLKRFWLPILTVGLFCLGLIAVSAHMIRKFEAKAIHNLEARTAETKQALEDQFSKKVAEHVGCREIASLPAELSEPGVYCLRRDLDNKNEQRDSITVFGNGITIKGNGFCINGSTTPTAVHSGIRAIDRSHLDIQNICVTGHKTGVLIGDTTDAYALNRGEYGVNAFRTSAYIKVTDSVFSRQTFQGIHVRGANVTVARNAIEHVGGVAGQNPFATGIQIMAVNCDISENRIFDLRPAGSGEGVGIAMYHGAACKASKNFIDPFRTTPHGRSYGIWSKGGVEDIGVFTDNIVVNADYAYGPFGVFKSNTAVNTACRPYVDRIFNLPPETLGGALLVEDTRLVNTRQKRACRDDIDYALAKAKETPNKFTAYAVVLAYGEKDPVKYEAIQLAWIMLAADMGHHTAMRIVNSSPTAGRTQASYERGMALYKKMKADFAVVN